MAQRLSENKKRLPGGPADLINVMTFTPSDDPSIVWQKGDIKVSAIKSRHIAGHASYRVDTPAGSVVIGGDAGNDNPKPPRDTSTSAQVEKLAMGADVVVHSTIHPVMGPDKDSGFPPPIYYRQSTATDLGRAGKKGRGQTPDAHPSDPAARRQETGAIIRSQAAGCPRMITNRRP